MSCDMWLDCWILFHGLIDFLDQSAYLAFSFFHLQIINNHVRRNPLEIAQSHYLIKFLFYRPHEFLGLLPMRYFYLPLVLIVSSKILGSRTLRLNSLIILPLSLFSRSICENAWGWIHSNMRWSTKILSLCFFFFHHKILSTHTYIGIKTGI